MRLVVDANVFVAAFMKTALTRELTSYIFYSR